jgi:hypothetical protein
MTHSLRLVFACLLSISVAALPIHAQHTPEEIKGTAKITGKVIDSDGDEVRGARVLAVHLSSSRVFAGEPSRANGEYVITGLPYGYFDLAVEIAEEIYVSNRVVNVAPAGTAAVIFTLVPFDPTTEGLTRPHPGSDAKPAGIARLRTKAKGREFWRSPKGVAIVSGVAGVGLLAIAAGSSAESISTSF